MFKRKYTYTSYFATNYIYFACCTMFLRSKYPVAYVFALRIFKNLIYLFVNLNEMLLQYNNTKILVENNIKKIFFQKYNG